MRKIYLLLSLCSGIFAFSQQPVVSPANPTINDLITITYGPGPGNAWTYLDPQGDSVLYLYLGMDTNNDVSTWEFNDLWNNCSATNLIPMNYNVATGKFEATFDLRTHNFQGSGGILPVGTTVYNGQYIIRRANTYECAPQGAPQSSWQGANMSFNITTSQVTLSVNDINFKQKNAVVVDGSLYFQSAGNFKIKIFDASGKLIDSETKNNVSAKTLLPLAVKTKGNYFILIEDENGNKQSLQFIK